MEIFVLCCDGYWGGVDSTPPVGGSELESETYRGAGTSTINDPNAAETSSGHPVAKNVNNLLQKRRASVLKVGH